MGDGGIEQLIHNGSTRRLMHAERILQNPHTQLTSLLSGRQSALALIHGGSEQLAKTRLWTVGLHQSKSQLDQPFSDVVPSHNAAQTQQHQYYHRAPSSKK